MNPVTPASHPPERAVCRFGRDLLGPKSWLLITAVTVFGGVLRLWSFDRVWINPDEGIYFSMVTWTDWGSFWSEYAGNAHPPLYYLLLRGMSVVAADVTALRSISLVMGCIWIVAMYLFVRECVGRGVVATLTGLGAASLVAISDSGIEMSQLIRPYATQLAILTLALFFLVRYTRAAAHRGLPAYAVLMILAVLTHYSTFLVLTAAALGCLGLLVVGALEKRQIRGLLVWNAPVLAVCVFCYWSHIHANLDGSEVAVGAAKSWLKEFMVESVAEVWPRFLGVFKSHLHPGFEGPAALLWLVGIGIAAHRRNVFFVATTVAMLGVALLASAAHKYPFGESRHSLYLLLVLAPSVALTIATALTSGWRVVVPALGVLGTLIGFHAFVTSSLGSSDLLRVQESTLQRRDLAVARTFYRQVIESPGFVMISKQTYFVLMPELHRERNAMRMSQDGTIAWFQWGKRTVLVLQDWSFRSGRDVIGHVAHLRTFTQRVDEQFPEFVFGQQHRVLLLIGEWSFILPIMKNFKDGPPGVRALVGRHAFVPGFAALEFDVAGYAAIVDSGLKAGK